MKITMKFDGLDRVQKQLDRLTGTQASAAYAKAINDTAFQVKRAMQQEFKTVFDRPTPYIVKSVYIRMASADNLRALVWPAERMGDNVGPQKILAAQELGGSRRDKRSEVLLRRLGILPANHQTVLPKEPYPGSDDGRGNIRGPFMVQLLSYFGAVRYHGDYSAMSAKRKGQIHAGTAKMSGRRYFVAGKHMGKGLASHLAPGIWASSGDDGAIVKPVLLFVRNPNYTPRISMERVTRQADADNYLSKRLRYRIRQASESLD